MTDQPKRIGRPPREVQRLTVSVRFEPQELAEIDKARGAVSRQDWIHGLALGHMRAVNKKPGRDGTLTVRKGETFTLQRDMDFDRVNIEEGGFIKTNGFRMLIRRPSPTPAQMAPVRAATERKIASAFRPHPKAGKK